MAGEASDPQDAALQAELIQLRGEVERLKQRNSDLEIRLQTTIEHGDVVEGQLYQSNLLLQAEIAERQQAEATLEQLREQTEALERRIEQRTTQLQKTEEKYRSIFENAAEGIFRTTVDGRYIDANPALAKAYGYDSIEDLVTQLTNIGKQLYVQPRRRDELNVYLKQFGTVEGFESEVYRKDRSTIWISENVREVRDAQGNLLYYEGSVRDITDRKNAEVQLREQRMRAERLLLNVLPQRIAERLKRREQTIADSFKEVTVLFADIVNFTPLSSQVSPVELVELLNQVFSEFDRLVDRYGLEKIKTIGDAYMAVGNLPSPKPDHVGAIASLALDMNEAIRTIRTPTQQPVLLRIGINVGPVVAGVIGTRKFIYDLWGDTVNIASRMESQGEPGRIQVTEAVYRELRGRFEMEERGIIDVKGRGQMVTYWLSDRHPL